MVPFDQQCTLSALSDLFVSWLNLFVAEETTTGEAPAVETLSKRNGAELFVRGTGEKADADAQ